MQQDVSAPSRDFDPAKFGLAIVLVAGGAFGIHQGARMLQIPEDVVWGATGSPALTVPHVYGLLRDGRFRVFPLLPPGVVPLAGFTLPWYFTVLIGAAVLAGAVELGSLVGALLVGDASGAVAVSLSAGLVGAYAIGRWIGMRADKLIVLAAIGAAVLARLVTSAVDFVLLNEADVQALFGVSRVELMTLQVVFGSMMWSVAALLGAWFGHRGRMASYVAYLLTRMAPKTADAVLEMAYEETRRSPGAQ